MKTHLTAWTALLLFVGALPALAEDEPKEDKPKEDTIVGTWYLQTMMGEVTPIGEMKLVFTEDDEVKVYQGSEEEDTVRYTHDKEKSKVGIYEGDDPTDTEAEFTYSFVDGVLVLLATEDLGGEPQVIVIEMTRKPEGSKRHQKMREEAGDDLEGPLGAARSTARAMQSATQLRGLHQGAVVFANSNKNTYPSSLGEMLPGDYFTPEYVLCPWSETQVPEDIDRWEDAKQIEWVNKNTSYVYLLAGKQVTLDSKLVAIFELPRSVDQEQVRVLFDDNHTESMLYADADKLIKKQTGHTLEQWMKTTEPGTGKLVVPEAEEAAEAVEEAAEAAADAVEQVVE